MSVRTYTVEVTPGGTAGSATGNEDSPTIRGKIVGIRVVYDSQPASTDVTIQMNDAPNTTILTLTNNNSDGTYYPAVQVDDSTGTPIGSEYMPVWVNGTINVSVDQGDPVNDGVTVYFLVATD